MMLRALNGSNSVYLAFLFTKGENGTFESSPIAHAPAPHGQATASHSGLQRYAADFFKHFAAPRARDGSPSVRCKIAVKAMQPVLSGIRSVDSTRIALADQGCTSYIIFQHKCTSGAVKTHALMYEDTEVFAAVYERSQAAHS